MANNFENLFDDYWEFSSKKFDTKPYDATKGLLREAQELKDIIDLGSDVPEFELEEMADVLFYLIYILKRSGYDYSNLLVAAYDKLEILKTRKWKQDETGCYSHIKD